MRLCPASVIALLALLAGTSLAGQTQKSSSRIAPSADLTPKTILSSHLPPSVNPQSDAGPAAEGTTVVLTFLLARTPTLQTAFDQLVADQHNPASSRFQHWLTPTQIGEQYGPTLAEINSVTQWINSQGLQVTSVSPSRTFIQATGPASAASAAFSVAFHVFDVAGQPRLAPTSAPTIPAAFAPVILAVEGLTDTPFQSFHAVHQIARAAADSIHPRDTSAQGAHYLFPGDFARIYDIAATTGSGYDGTGIRVAIAGQSRVTPTDITELQTMAGLPTKAPNTILVPTSSDPGLVRGDEDEATLDVTRVLTSAPGVEADLVIASASSGGVSTAIQYSINTVVDPILSISYGACEASASASSVQFYNLLFQQAAAEGISTFISSGDSAAAGCSRAFSTPTGTETRGMGNYLCSSSYVTCVGGTEFADAGAASTYWSTTNSANEVSALGYIPEGAWNEPTVTGSNGNATYQIAGSGSGPSAFITKPTWQTGPGVPTDGARDIPDIAFTAAGHDGYFACLAYLGAGADCSRGGGVIFSGTSATAPGMAAIAALLNQRLGKSQGNLNPLLYRLAAAHPEAFHDATPASSGVATCSTATPSLCNNSTPGPGSLSGGLAGYALQTGYDLVTGLGSLDVTNFLNAADGKAQTQAAPTIIVNASSSTIAVGQAVTFTASVQTTGTPAPTGTIQFFSNTTSLTAPLAVADIVVSPALTFSTAGTDSITAVYSGDSNYTTSTSPAVPLTVTSMPAAVTIVSATPSSIAIGQQTTLTATVTSPTGSGPVPTGTIQFALNGTLTAAPATLRAGTASLSFTPAAAGTYTLTAVYSGDTNYSTSTSPTVPLTVTSIPAAITLVSVVPSTITVGQPTLYAATVTSTTGSIPTGTVQFALNGTAAAAPQTLKAGAASLSVKPSSAGTFTLTAIYSGDASNGPSTSAPATLVVQAIPTVTALAVSSTLLNAGDADVLTATMSTSSSSSPTGTMQFFAGSTSLGSAPLASASASLTSAFPVAGNYPITAVYSGDATFSTSTSSPTSLTVNPLGRLNSLNLSVTPTTATLSSTSVTTATGTVTLTTADSFTGAVTLVCTVTSISGNSQAPPTCSLSTNSVAFNSARSATATILLSTETPRAQQTLNPIARLAPNPATPIGAVSLAALCVLFPFARRRKALALLPLLLIGTMLPLTGCGSTIVPVSGSTGGTGITPTSSGTTAGTYTVTLLAASGAVTAMTALTLTVK